MDKSDAAQYTKVAEDANNKQEAYDSARKASRKRLLPLRAIRSLFIRGCVANVQGAGPDDAGRIPAGCLIGSLPQRAQIAWQRTLTGKLPPEMEQMFLADIKRAYETSRDEAANLRKRLAPGSSQPPQTSNPSPHAAFDPNDYPVAQ